MNDFKENMENGLRCSIDWLSFTVTDTRDLISTLRVFGFSYTDFYLCEKGAMGYKKMLMLHGSALRVLYDGNDNMGVHFDVPGSAIPDLFSYFSKTLEEWTPWHTYALDIDISLVMALMDCIQTHGHVTRLDLAVDDTEKVFYTVGQLEGILCFGDFVSKFRHWQSIQKKSISGKLEGYTIYLGSRSSDVMLRVYDKQLEQNGKRGDSEEPIMYEWVRWELELKGERAQLAAKSMIDGISVGALCIGVLSNYFRVIVRDDSNKSRCSTDPKWQRFIDGIQALRLYVHHDEKSLDDKKAWILRQVAPTLTGIIIADYGDMSFLTNHLELQAGRMKPGLRDMVSRANPGWEESLKVFAGLAG